MFIDERWMWVVLLAFAACIVLRHCWNQYMGPVIARRQMERAANREVELDEEMVRVVERESGRPAVQMMGLRKGPWPEPLNGLEVAVVESAVQPMIERLRSKLDGAQYQVFLCDPAIGGRRATVGVLKATDPYDALRAMGTGNASPHQDVEVVIAKLKEWQQRVPFEITTVSGVLVEAELEELPEDPHAFAHELLEFCPDLFQDVDSVEELAEEIRTTGKFHLWWD